MQSQSFTAQLIKMFIFMSITLLLIHQSDRLIPMIAEYAMGFGCHQKTIHINHHL